MTLLLGLVTGIIFGFFMQRARVIRYDRQVGALRLMDMTILKFMLSAIIVASVGIYILHDFGAVKLDIKSTSLGGNLLGGIIFGLGWGLLGYCPGTAAGALGEGRLDALWGVLGFIVGGMLFAELYPLFQSTVLKWGAFGKITLPSVTAVSHWIIIPVFAVIVCFLFRFFEKKKL
jgi:uncharacterized membrane protein YedE/YeeE